MHNTIFCHFFTIMITYMDLSLNLLKNKEDRAKSCEKQDSRWIYQVVKMLRVAVINRTVLLISGEPFPVPVAPPIALRQGARVAGASASAPAPASSVDTGRHRRSPRTRSSLESVRLLTTRLNLTAQLGETW